MVKSELEEKEAKKEEKIQEYYKKDNLVNKWLENWPEIITRRRKRERREMQK